MVILSSDDVAVTGVTGVASVTFTVNAYTPAVVGLPEITPVAGSRVKPGGSGAPATRAHV